MDGSVRLIILAAVLLVLGVALPFLMVMGIVEATIPLSFVSVACSTAGFITGFIALAQYVRQRRGPGP